jgi:hypothetical protein
MAHRNDDTTIACHKCKHLTNIESSRRCSGECPVIWCNECVIDLSIVKTGDRSWAMEKYDELILAVEEKRTEAWNTCKGCLWTFYSTQTWVCPDCVRDRNSLCKIHWNHSQQMEQEARTNGKSISIKKCRRCHTYYNGKYTCIHCQK